MSEPGPSPQKRLDRLHLLFAASSLAMLAVFLVAAYQDHNREWKKHQIEFRRVELSKVSDDAQRAKVRARGLEIQQYWLPDLVVEPRDARGVPDRCITCHAAILRPAFRDEKNPHKAHPGLDGWFRKHNVEEIGCVVCHEGQGPATESHAAHGPVHHWLEPMLESPHLQSSCVKCHTLDEPIAGIERLRRGRAIAQKFHCNVCHKIVGEGGSIGPELVDIYKKVDTGTGILHDLAWQQAHLKDPRKMSDDTSAMPNFLLNDDDLADLMTWVLSLNTKRVQQEHWSPSLVAARGRPQPPLPGIALAPLPPLGRTMDEVRARRLEYVAAGKKLYEGTGCTACHSVNVDAHHRERGKPGPDFVNLAGGERDEAWIVDFMALPMKWFPGLPMPPYPQLSVTQRRQIALYLLSPKLPEELQEPKSPVSRALKRLIGYRKPTAREKARG